MEKATEAKGYTENSTFCAEAAMGKFIFWGVIAAFTILSIAGLRKNLGARNGNGEKKKKQSSNGHLFI